MDQRGGIGITIVTRQQGRRQDLNPFVIAIVGDVDPVLLPQGDTDPGGAGGAQRSLPIFLPLRSARVCRLRFSQTAPSRPGAERSAEDSTTRSKPRFLAKGMAITAFMMTSYFFASVGEMSAGICSALARSRLGPRSLSRF